MEAGEDEAGCWRSPDESRGAGVSAGERPDVNECCEKEERDG